MFLPRVARGGRKEQAHAIKCWGMVPKRGENSHHSRTVDRATVETPHIAQPATLLDSLITLFLVGPLFRVGKHLMSL